MAIPRGKGKPRAEPRPTMPGKNGGTLLRGGDGVSGGRPPDEFKRMCRELASSDEVRKNVAKILAAPASYPKLYVGALKWASENGYGRPLESIDLTHSGEVTVKQEWTFGLRKVGF